MSNLKSKRGGKREGAGRKPDGPSPRVIISAKVLPDTKVKIDELRGSQSIGKFLDSIVKK